MNSFDRKVRRAARLETGTMPSAVRTMVLQTLAALPEKPAVCRRRRASRILAALAAVLALFIAVPNLSVQAAAAMREMPVIGGLIDVVLVRNYLHRDGNHYADIQIPQIVVDAQDTTLKNAVQEINVDVEAITSRLIQEFEAGAAAIGEEGHTEVDVYYQTITDSDTWFTLEVLIYYGSGSGSSQYKYYHIDKETGRLMQLSDLFQENSGYVQAISTHIQEQMRKQTAAGEAVYWIDGEMPGNEFHWIREDANFFFADNGNLVIRFDENEEAPGAYGCPQFEIPREVYEDCLREDYRERNAQKEDSVK